MSHAEKLTEPLRIAKLKSGETLEIKSLKPDDAIKVLEYLKKVGGESDNLTFGAEGLGISEEEEREILESYIESKNRILVGGWIGSRLISVAGISAASRARISHIGELAISVVKDFWRRGVATEMIFALKEWSKQRGIKKIELKVRADNHSAQSLYRKLGFQNEGFRRASLEVNGKLVDEHYMGLMLESEKSTALKLRPDCIKHFSEIQDPDNAHYPDSEELLSIGSPFGKTFGFKKLGIHHEVLLPGRRTSYPHAEEDEEEFAYVIEGTPDVWIDGHLYRLGPGDGVGFPCGTGICHTFINNTTSTVRFLVVGEKSKPHNRIFYPLNLERKAQLKPELWWDDVPKRPLGPHDGKPNKTA